MHVPMLEHILFITVNVTLALFHNPADLYSDHRRHLKSGGHVTFRTVICITRGHVTSTSNDPSARNLYPLSWVPLPVLYIIQTF